MKKHELCDESKKILKSDLEDANYNAYIGKSQKNICSQKDFCKYLFERIKNIQPTTKDEEELIRRIEESRAFPKQVSKENGVIPYQLNLYELEKILENAEKYLPFLLSKDKDELTNVAILRERMFYRNNPYYIVSLIF